MGTSSVDAGLLERALEKLARDDSLQVAAVMVGRTGPHDLDGFRWTFVVTDGNKATTVDAQISGSQMAIADKGLSDPVLEAAVERAVINRYPIEARMGNLEAADLLTLLAEEIR